MTELKVKMLSSIQTQYRPSLLKSSAQSARVDSTWSFISLKDIFNFWIFKCQKTKLVVQQCTHGFTITVVSYLLIVLLKKGSVFKNKQKSFNIELEKGFLVYEACSWQ